MTDKQIKRSAALAAIRSNIERTGYHVYIVAQGVLPRYAYTIGLSPVFGNELILAGAILYMGDEVKEVVAQIAAVLRGDKTRLKFDLGPLGTFTLKAVHRSWAESLMLGAMDYYDSPSVQGLQVVPDAQHWTNDVPDLSHSWDPKKEPVWQWMKREWPYPFPSDSTAVTDLAALRGEPIREAARWEDSQWELFTKPAPDLDKSDVRIVPLATLLALDTTLSAAADLKVGDGVLRDDRADPWREWG